MLLQNFKSISTLVSFIHSPEFNLWHFKIRPDIITLDKQSILIGKYYSIGQQDSKTKQQKKLHIS